MMMRIRKMRVRNTLARCVRNEKSLCPLRGDRAKISEAGVAKGILQFVYIYIRGTREESILVREKLLTRSSSTSALVQRKKHRWRERERERERE